MVKHYVAVAVLVVLATLVLSLAVGGIENVVPTLASEQGSFVDRLLNIELQLIFFVFSLIIVVMLYSAVVFRRKSDDEEDGAYFRGNTKLEVVWTVIPLGVVLALATLSANFLVKVDKSVADEMVINVTGFQWDWRFEYPDYDISSADLNMPLDRQVRFEMTSEDVIHSFWVPEFRIKKDLVPGMTTTLRIRPTEQGQYALRCAELCGTRHAYMIGRVNVMEPADFDAWVATEQAAAEQISPEELGAKVAQENGCISCHSLDGSTLVGPTWKGLYGAEQRLSDGTMLKVDEAYLRNAIIDPNAQIVEGFPANVMPEGFADRLTEEEINGLIEYIKSLGE